ncbi:MAG: hypothetical protein ACREWG_14685 [Gammaproteobacteria bacterium]
MGLGVLAVGGMAIGGVVLGGIALAVYLAVGGVALSGAYAVGGLALAPHAIGALGADPEFARWIEESFPSARGLIEDFNR